tara:strand:- start:1223 stop:1918 length:696 start_codon:yes stop_codon:yes gene_type:complete
MRSSGRILIIAAHPDDDILGCGGFISKYSDSIDFRVIFIAEGSSCRFSYSEIKTQPVQETIKFRNDNGIEALKVLGVSNFNFYNLPCGRLDQISLIEINKIIESEINEFKPDTIFTHSDNDTNNDHRIVFKSTLIATRPGSNYFVKNLYSYEVLSSSEWNFTEAFQPNYFQELSEEDIQKKWEALKKYKTEIKDFPYPRSYEGIKILANYRGMQSNNTYAEAFKMIRQIQK